MHVDVLGVTVPWLAGLAASIPSLADTGGLFLSGLPSSWMVDWAGGKLLCPPVDSSPGKLLGEVASFSAEVLSLEWSKLGWGENRDMDIWPQCIHPRSGPIGVNQCAFFSATFTLLGMRGCCPSCPRTLGLSSGLFSLWSSSSLSLPASSGKTREQASHLSPCSVDSEASRSSFLNFKVEEIICLHSSFRSCSWNQRRTVFHAVSSLLVRWDAAVHAICPLFCIFFHFFLLIFRFEYRFFFL